MSVERLNVSIKADSTPLKYILLRWNFTEGDIPTGFTKVLGDEWERAYGTMEWRSINPDIFMPWYFFITDSSDSGKQENHRTSAFGVRVRPNAFCFWNLDNAGATLWIDIRNGGSGVLLSGRTLEAATVVFGDYDNISSFNAAQNFCRVMCDDGIFPKEPVYGSNNWYYAYGKSSHEEIIRDATIVAEYTKDLENRPFMVIDDGWQPNSCDAPWDRGNERFPDMKRLADEISAMDVKPGIWIRLLIDLRRETPGAKDEWRLSRDNTFFDPSHPEVIKHVKSDIKRLVDWGYKLIKHDYSTYDMFGAWGCFLKKSVVEDDQSWAFYDRSRTGAEITLDFYRAIREAAGDTLIIGCDTFSHLSAGLVEINRTGDDTSGHDWLRTRKFGVNTLAFRLPQNGIFYMADADCVGITPHVPWEKNRLWLKALSLSGSPLFVSCTPDLLNSEQEEEVKQAFTINSVQKDSFIPLDWTETTCPSEWLHNGEEITFNWFE
ncbi:MAG: hypothetical protein A2Y15_09535 [Clostridiales bacterium GWF2_36_10]|nr:MAG: hypothetical protein A2Y15_09535 [Clostridiales bacterium GWF2_36_10]